MDAVTPPRFAHVHRMRTLLVAVMTLAMAVVTVPAHAALSELPDPTDMTDGRVNSIVRAGERIFIAGEFTEVYSDPSGPAVARANVAAFFADTGRLDPDWIADADDRVFRIRASSTHLYMGGDFRVVNGVDRRRFVAVDLETGAVDEAFESDANAKVTAILVDEPHVYIGGDFSQVEGTDREHLARVDAASGDVDPGWNPGADDRAWDMDLSVDGQTLYLGGTFTRVGGQHHNHIAALDKSTGQVLSSFDGDSQYDTRNIAVDADRVYAAIEGPGGRVSAFDLTTGQRVWSHYARGDAQAVEAAHGRLYVGGHFRDYDGANVQRFVMVDPTNGEIDGSFQPVINSGPSGSNDSLGVWAIVADGPDLLVGGDFTRVEGISQHRFARFRDATANTTPTVSITAPPNGTTVDAGDSIDFTATANDAEDGDLSASVTWESDLDGSLGTGAAVAATLSTGVHRVSATVVDGGGLSASDQLTVTVNAPGTAPTVSITAPADGTAVDAGVAVDFMGTASDAEDGDLSGSITWSSDRDGNLGTGSTVTATLSSGTHVVTATVVDSDGRSAGDAVSVTVQDAVSIESILQNGFGGRRQNKHLDTIISVVDANGAAVSGADLSVTLYRGSDASMSDATAHASTSGLTEGGVATITFKNLPRSSCYRVVVTAVDADGALWDGVSPAPDPDPWCK